MTQKEIFYILKSLGGKATVAQIKEAYTGSEKKDRAANHFATYISEKLTRLRKWGYIDFAYEDIDRGRRGYYTLKEQEYDRDG